MVWLRTIQYQRLAFVQLELCAFQGDAFQNDAFQICNPGAVAPAIPWPPYTDPSYALWVKRRIFSASVPSLFYTPFVPPSETITVDKWFEPLSERLVKSKLRSAEYPAFAYGATPIVNNVDQWWQNLSTPPKTKPRTVEFPAFAYGPTPIVVPVDGWWNNLATPPKVKPRPIEFTAFTYGASPTEVITVDKWFEPLSERNVKTKLRSVEFQAFTFGQQPIVNTPDQWWQNLAIPPKAKPRSIEFPAIAQGYPPIINGPDQWWQNLATPPKVKQRSVEYQPAFIPPYQRTPADGIEWWRQLSEPYPSKRGMNSQFQQAAAFVPGAVLESITMDKWWRQFSDPRKLSKDRTVDFPAFTFGPTPIVSTPDRWWRNLETPPKGKRRAPEYPFSAAFPIQPQARDQIAWFNPWIQPKRERFGQRYWEQRETTYPYQNIAQALFLGWYNQLSQPDRKKFGQKYWEQKELFYPYQTVIRPYAIGYVIC